MEQHSEFSDKDANNGLTLTRQWSQYIRFPVTRITAFSN